jgi:hypothetical protein
MKRFVVGAERDQPTLFPECLEDWVDENNPVRVIDVFVDNLDMADLCFARVDPQAPKTRVRASSSVPSEQL